MQDRGKERQIRTRDQNSLSSYYRFHNNCTSTTNRHGSHRVILKQIHNTESITLYVVQTLKLVKTPDRGFLAILCFICTASLCSALYDLLCLLLIFICSSFPFFSLKRLHTLVCLFLPSFPHDAFSCLILSLAASQQKIIISSCHSLYVYKIHRSIDKYIFCSLFWK